MTDHRDWTGKVGSVWAQEWRRTDRSFRNLTPRLLAAAESEGFAHALDVGCGAGELTCHLAGTYPSARVTGIDIAPELLDVARERAANLDNARFVLGDAATTPVDGPAPDLIVSRHGVMFFTDPPQAFAHLHQAAASGARMVFSCFRSRAESSWVGATMAALPVLPPAPDPFEPGPFAFADRDRVAGILAQGGWRDIDFQAVDLAMVFGGGADPVADARDYLTRVGPTSSAIAALDDGERAAALDRLVPILERASDGEQVTFPAAMWLVTARAA